MYDPHKNCIATSRIVWMVNGGHGIKNHSQLKTKKEYFRMKEKWRMSENFEGYLWP